MVFGVRVLCVGKAVRRVSAIAVPVGERQRDKTLAVRP